MPQRAASAKASSAARRLCEGVGGGIFDHTSVLGRLFAHNSGRLAVGVMIDLAAWRIGRLRGDSRRLQRRRVGNRDVSIHPAENGGMIAGHRVEVLAAWAAVALSPERVVPAAADEPFARGSQFLACAAMRCCISCSDRTPRQIDARSGEGPPASRCTWASLKPGITKWPPRSTTCVWAPFNLRMSSLDPTATMRPSRTAMACARAGVACV